jgi:hypothetical protein
MSRLAKKILNGRPVDRHRHWSARAADYRRLADAVHGEEARKVLNHLANVCSQMAKATAPVATPRTEDLWIHPSEVVREATGQRWRIREAKYLAIADNCESDDGKRAWATIAGRCAELADYLERT